VSRGPDPRPQPVAARIGVRVLVRPALALPLPHRIRRGWFELLAKLDRVPEEFAIAELRLGGVPAERIDPPGSTEGSILYLHGGGYVFGSPRSYRPITSRLAVRSSATVYSLDYRLAPEHPFPAALDDALNAYRALGELSAGEPIALAGDSAGAGLALVLALRARDEELPSPAAICLLCPWLDLESNGSLAGHDRDRALPRVFVERGAAEYLAGHDPRDPRCSPAFADLSNLPPILVHAAGEDILLPEAERFAQRAAEAGTEVEFRRFDALWHDFHAQAGALPTADAAIAEAGEFVRERLAAATRPRA